MKILFFGDQQWATDCLRRLLDDRRAIAAVVVRRSPSDPSLGELAARAGLPLLQPADVNSDLFVGQVRGIGPDLNLSVSYDQILREPILGTAPLGFINFHGGKLPHYRGRSIINWAILNGETEVGITGHYIDGGIDTGDIILQRTVPVGWTDDYGRVMANVVAALPGVVAETVDLIAAGRAPRVRQAHLPGSYFARRQEGDEWLDWSDTSRNLYNKVRAISHPAPGARTTLGDQTVVVWRAEYDASWPKYTAIAGQVVGRGPRGVVVKTADSTLRLLETQVAGDPPRVPDWRIGTRLGLDLRAEVVRLAAEVQRLSRQVGQTGDTGRPVHTGPSGQGSESR